MNLEDPSCKSSGKGHEVHIITGRDPVGQYIKILTCQCLNYFFEEKIHEGLAKKEDIFNP